MAVGTQIMEAFINIKIIKSIKSTFHNSMHIILLIKPF